MSTMKAKEVTISGSFVAGDKEIVSFSDLKGVMPAVDDDKVNQMAIKRYAAMWLALAKDDEGEPIYKRVTRVRQVFVDSVDDVEGEFTYIGKSIMQMSFEELQDLAAANDLNEIPLYKVSSLVTQRRVAFGEYAAKVLGWTEKNEQGKEAPINHRAPGYNPSKYEDIIADGEIRRSGEYVAPIEETIDREQLVLNKKLAPTVQSRLTLEQLKEIATQKKIAFSANIGHKALHEKIYGKGSAAAAA